MQTFKGEYKGQGCNVYTRNEISFTLTSKGALIKVKGHELGK